MNIVVSLFVTIMAGVITHYIIKWLGGDHKGNK
jgi:hypothetical protein